MIHRLAYTGWFIYWLRKKRCHRLQKKVSASYRTYDDSIQQVFLFVKHLLINVVSLDIHIKKITHYGDNYAIFYYNVQVYPNREIYVHVLVSSLLRGFSSLEI